ncbi:MAG: GerAB/ArcD/ProY family transporter [Syntrophomonadaceae bacterium]|nr:GerAB/ArcD/ProY family transporter [Syntrophomonadaceae bacterium]
MVRITNLQIYCLLMLTTAPLAYLAAPMVAIHTISSSAWLATLAAIIPGALLIYIYLYILKKSSRPFPACLEDCLGKVLGKTLGFLYILIFFWGIAFTLQYFIALIGSSIVPDTPLSVYIGAMLLTSYYALKTGLQNIARISQILIIYGFPFAFLAVFISLAQNYDISGLLPLFSTSFKDFGQGVFISFVFLGDLIGILVLAFFSTHREEVPRTLYYVLYTYIALITLTALASSMEFGTEYTNLIAFPAFKLVRYITISDFIKNIDAAFIALWIIGIFGAITVKWFLACYTIQQVFNLKDYKFIAAPSSVALGIISLAMGKNIIALQVIVHDILPVIYGAFYIVVPLIVFGVLLFKPNPAVDAASGLKSPSA